MQELSGQDAFIADFIDNILEDLIEILCDADIEESPDDNLVLIHAKICPELSSFTSKFFNFIDNEVTLFDCYTKGTLVEEYLTVATTWRNLREIFPEMPEYLKNGQSISKQYVPILLLSDIWFAWSVLPQSGKGRISH